ncbi:hypothetical protein H257_19397 [Aphanomyces astaci]|uniref:Uncharacterized protein n=1 Tax=Aphanomyces astaci TaxID=112090 RepID=W4F871_APHAT|nr:hypothetical protein H257_19397 [Aphanomyces astaci]ETV63670.1 hypothetical protein H257_19397 [Aphanomyces astaci]|eukprot:XP_009846846.1 hypothetical protein H257_19397 [Aphanomyces astaci]
MDAEKTRGTSVTFENQSRVEESSEASVAWCTHPPGEIPTLVQVNVPGALDPSTMLYTGNLVERGKVPQALPDYAHIGVVSSAFGLRMRQHLSFTCIARALLQRWQLEDNGDHDPRSVATATSAIQLRMVLHGEGGTGKSHVIAAVQAFCNSWKRPFSIAKTAMTGKAAVSINGVTLHSWIGMHNLTPSTVHEAKEADEKGVPSYTEDLKLLLVDEMSMMNKQQLVRLDKALRARTKLDLPFDYHVGRKKAAMTRTSREEEQNIQMENDDGRTEPDDFDDIDFENALLVASRHPATRHLNCDDACDTTSELYQAVSSSEMNNQVKYPTTTPIDADMATLVGGQSLDEASTTASSSYMSILGAWDQRLRCREQFA